MLSTDMMSNSSGACVSNMALHRRLQHLCKATCCRLDCTVYQMYHSALTSTVSSWRLGSIIGTMALPSRRCSFLVSAWMCAANCRVACRYSWLCSSSSSACGSGVILWAATALPAYVADVTTPASAHLCQLIGMGPQQPRVRQRQRCAIMKVQGFAAGPCGQRRAKAQEMHGPPHCGCCNGAAWAYAEVCKGYEVPGA
jgi:hypothetical protein